MLISTSTRGIAAGIDGVLSTGAVRSVYQPIVELRSGRTVAYEALARGLPGSALESPVDLFGAALAADRLAELDRLCSTRAIEGAAAVLPTALALFVNVEPAAVTLPVPADPPDGIAGPMQVVIELTERALTERPAELLALVGEIRRRGWRVALDDVGADPRSLALMPLLRPDVIKLDLALVQQRPTLDIAGIVAAVSAYAEHSGAVVLAEGVETLQHVEIAQSMGARLGQGWYFGRPGPLPDTSTAPRSLESPLAQSLRWPERRTDASPHRRHVSPFDEATAGSEVLRSTKPLLIQMSKHLEHRALALGSTAVVLSTFQHARYFTAHTAIRYERLSASLALVAAIGEEMPDVPAVGVRGGRLSAHDPVRHEWDIAVVSPHLTAALVARDLGDTGPESQRRFDYVLTYDRAKVTAVAHSLMARLLPDR